MIVVLITKHYCEHQVHLTTAISLPAFTQIYILYIPVLLIFTDKIISSHYIHVVSPLPSSSGIHLTITCLTHTVHSSSHLDSSWDCDSLTGIFPEPPHIFSQSLSCPATAWVLTARPPAALPLVT